MTEARRDLPATGELMTLSRWFSPAFPVGGFAWSHGLETAVEAGEVTDAASCEAWLATVLRDGSGLTDAVLLCHALRGGDPAALDAEAAARSASVERRGESLEQGAAFARTIGALGGPAVPEVAMPVAVGMAARRLTLPPELVAAQYLQAFAGNLVQAAVRLVPLGQTAGQAVLTALAPVCEAVAARAATLDLDEVGTAAFGADLAAMAHETQAVRLFRS